MESGFTKRARAGGLAKNEKVRIASKEKIEGNCQFELLNNREKRARILLEQNFSCLECGINQEYNGKPIKFELDHINGNRKDDSRKNLRFLCPNCHSQTDTYKIGNNKNPGNKIYSDDDIVKALNNNTSAYSALKSLGMNPHGGNYVRIRKLIKEKNIILPYYVL